MEFNEQFLQEMGLSSMPEEQKQKQQEKSKLYYC